MTEFAEKLRGIGFLSRRGSVDHRVVRASEDGSVAGVETEHWDGRRDAQAMLQPVKVKARRVERR